MGEQSPTKEKQMITIKNLDNQSTITVTPSAMKWSLQDVSAADSGRDVTGYMYKNMVTQKRKLELEFTGWKWSDVSSLLQVLNSEYFLCTFPDMLSGQVETRTFYAGDRECPVYVWWDGAKILSTTTVNFIER